MIAEELPDLFKLPDLDFILEGVVGDLGAIAVEEAVVDDTKEASAEK